MRVPALLLLWCLLCCVVGCETPTIEITTPNISVQQDDEGAGPTVKAGDIVTIDYTVSLPDGTHVLREEGFRFQLGRGAVIEGVDLAVEGMRVGGRRVVSCPPNRHWGRQGYGDGLIPPNTYLDIEVRLVAVR